MQLLTTLLSCLLSLFGSLDPASTASITRVAGRDGDALFSKTTLADGVATFECFASASGGCHYRVYEEACAGVPATMAPPVKSAADACSRRTLDVFALDVGKRREVEGLPAGFRHCVAQDDAATCG
ncbi:hypothetical protein [Pseudoxanthomonas koreensis]|uniref:hypothetical protein n=1 Tax=Pseudoxanthomonas koreensis TaxID=266061 RepID=UPI0013913E75|nr:hypothetical protein [Pseudoxanthomonas koreensis]KAF1694955.1 hypothetical protein CSC64_03775 [Pseudoxanthomonas koreensis]